MKPITVVVHGAMGKMGKAVINAVCQDPELRLVGAVDIKITGDRLQLPDNSGSIPLSSDLDSILTNQKPDVMVDFSVAKASMPAIRLAARSKINLVIGTTGFTPADVEEIKKARRDKRNRRGDDLQFYHRGSGHDSPRQSCRKIL